MLGVEKGRQMVFGNKMKSLLSRKPDFDFFFFFLAKTCCVSTAIWQSMVESGDVTLDFHGDEDVLTNDGFHHCCVRF